MKRVKGNFWLIGLSFLALLMLLYIPAFASAPHSNKANPIFSDQIIIIGLLLLLGFAGGKFIEVIKLPAVTGYVLIGILLGISALKIVKLPMIRDLRFIEVLGLSMVALIIGGDLHIKKLRQLGKMVIIVTIVQVMGAFLMVSLVTGLLLKLPWSLAIILGAISSATAPAATVAVIHQYKAKGPFTDTLMTIVAFDDAVCVMLFSVAIAMAKLMTGSSVSLIRHLLLPFWDIGGSFVVGSIIAIITIVLMKWVRDRHELVILTVGIAFLFGELAQHFHMSALLVNMVYGFVLVNFSPNPRVLHGLVDIELPIFVCFFTLAGCSLNLGILFENWLPALLFIVARGIGKVAGVYIGGVISNAPSHIKRHLGFAMLPQAGVAIALVIAVQSELPGAAQLITAIVLAAVAVNEVIGPMGTKYALTKAGEVHKMEIHEEAQEGAGM